MDEGFILSNKYRRAIFDEFAAGETNIKRIAKKHRIIPTIVQRVVDDFIKGDIIKKQGKKYVFTKKGEKLIETIGK
ncbi:MAG: winged helix-turn-helix domain-containing protein [Petrotogales bacterium]